MDASPGFSLWISGPPGPRGALAAALAARVASRGVDVRREETDGRTVLACAPSSAGVEAGTLPAFAVEADGGDAGAAADGLIAQLEARGALPPADDQAARDEAMLLERLRGLGYL